jgi:hypothetical protein
MDEPAMSAGEIIERMLGLLRDNAVPAAIVTIVLTALGTASDHYNPDAMFSLPLSLGSAIAQYWITRQALAREGLLAADLSGAVGAFIGVSILSGLGILLGLLLLIVPGIFLLLRWAPAVPLVLGIERLRATDALGESWRRTQGHWPAIGAAYALTLIPFAGALLAYAWEVYELPEQLAALAVANIMLNLWGISTWLLGVAVYQGFARRDHELEEVFA